MIGTCQSGPCLFFNKLPQLHTIEFKNAKSSNHVTTWAVCSQADDWSGGGVGRGQGGGVMCVPTHSLRRGRDRLMPPPTPMS